MLCRWYIQGEYYHNAFDTIAKAEAVLAKRIEDFGGKFDRYYIAVLYVTFCSLSPSYLIYVCHREGTGLNLGYSLRVYITSQDVKSKPSRFMLQYWKKFLTIFLL